MLNYTSCGTAWHDCAWLPQIILMGWNVFSKPVCKMWNIVELLKVSCLRWAWAGFFGFDTFQSVILSLEMLKIKWGYLNNLIYKLAYSYVVYQARCRYPQFLAAQMLPEHKLKLVSHIKDQHVKKKEIF